MISTFSQSSSFILNDDHIIHHKIEFNVENKKYTLITSQYRIPIGDYSKSIPAGMIDENGKIILTVLKEFKEEINPDFKIKQKDFKFLYNGFLSSGGSDEKMDVYIIEKTITKKELKKYQGRITGSISENEEIKLEVKELEELKKSNDIKTRLSYWEYINKKGKK